MYDPLSGCPRSQRKVPDTLNLKLNVFLSFLLYALGTQPQSSGEQSHLKN